MGQREYYVLKMICIKCFFALNCEIQADSYWKRDYMEDILKYENIINRNCFI